MHEKKKILNPLHYFFLKVKKFHNFKVKVLGQQAGGRLPHTLTPQSVQGLFINPSIESIVTNIMQFN